MAVRQTIPYNHGIFFITITCHKWLPLIEQTNSYDAVYNWFDHLKSKRHYIIGYTIMPNHLHALIGFQNTGKSINTIIGNGKRFMAYEIVKRLEQQNETLLLEQMQQAVETKDRQRNKQHEVWDDSFDWKDCRSDDFIKQKLVYIHNNPCKGKWNLAACPEQYKHSSAHFYLTGEQGYYPVTNYMELKDMDLSKLVE
jgi:REP element-mobilizing transposase RayT